jgi:hypothetical protein
MTLSSGDLGSSEKEWLWIAELLANMTDPFSCLHTARSTPSAEKYLGRVRQ